MALVDVGGTALDVRFVDPGTPVPRPPLVFLHEGLGSIELWRTFPDDVRSGVEDPAMLVYSRAGYGHSAPARVPRPVTYMHEEADRVLPVLLERFAIERPVLIGHSDGASIALLHAGAGYPVAGLVLLAPHVFVEDLTVESIAAARDAFATTDLPARMARYHDDAGATFRGWNDVWLSPEFGAWNIEDRLATIDAPMLLIQAADDPFGTMAQLDAIEKRVTGPTRRLEIAHGGHSPHLGAPAATLDAVHRFLTEIGDQEDAT